MKLRSGPLSPDQTAAARLADALNIAGRALIEASAILSGKNLSGCTPVAPPTVADPWLTVVDLVNEFLMAKARSQRSDRYLRQLRVSLKSFSKGRARSPISQIETAAIEHWLRGQEWSPKTERNYLSDLRTVFNYAVKRGYLSRNPATAVELPRMDGRSTIAIHMPDQVKELLATARRADLDVCRHLAVRYFAGVRSAEAHRLREEDLKLEQNLLEVPATKSKTRARRLVTIQPNLKAWLDLGGELRPLSDMTIRKVIRLSKVDWAHNVTRHSFVSYHLAKFENAHKTALEAGHTEQMLFTHYRALVTPAAAAEFWSIVPE